MMLKWWDIGKQGNNIFLEHMWWKDQKLNRKKLNYKCNENFISDKIFYIKYNNYYMNAILYNCLINIWKNALLQCHLEMGYKVNRETTVLPLE